MKWSSNTDVGGINAAIMTGKTFQLRLTLAKAHWERFGLIGFAIGVFFPGGIVACLIKRHLRHPPLELLLMAVILAIVRGIRLHLSLRIPVELPLLTLAMECRFSTPDKPLRPA